MYIIAENWDSEIYKEFIKTFMNEHILFINTSESLDVSALKLAKFKSDRELIFIDISNIRNVSAVSPDLTSRTRVTFKSSDYMILGNAETKFIINYLMSLGRYDVLLDIF
jgi:hypothetical protein